jgi:hypothetical protein
MLRVTVEIVPGGDESQAKVIERMLIANVSGLADVSDYDTVFTYGGKTLYGEVFDHARMDGAWELIRSALSGGVRKRPLTGTHRDLQERLQK